MQGSWFASTAATRVAAAPEPVHHALQNTAAFAGFTAYALMVGTIVWGVFTATGVVRRNIRRETLHGGHMTMAVAALAFVIVHGVANVLRPAADLTIWNAVIPSFRANATVAVGVLSAEFAIVTSASVWFQRRIGYRTWQLVHRLGYPTYGLAVAHMIMAGSDVRRPLIAIIFAVTVAIAAVLTAFRFLPATSNTRDRFIPNAGINSPTGPFSVFLARPEEIPGSDLRIRVDVNRRHCHRYAICEQEAPEVFQMRADGRLDYERSPDPAQRDAIRQAARLCPMQAIVIKERRR